MTILHVQRTSAFDKNDFAQCIATIQSNDALVLIDDGCYNLTHSMFNTLKNQYPDIKIFHIDDHAQARAVKIENSQSQPIAMAQLVELTFEYDSTITWQ